MTPSPPEGFRPSPPPPPPPPPPPATDLAGATTAGSTSLAATATAAPASPAASSSASLGPSGRGLTEVTDQAARRLAIAAAREVPGVGGPSASGLARLRSDSRHDEPRDIDANAGVHEDQVSLDLTVGVEYPRPVRATLEQLAMHVTRRLGEYGGLRVDRLDITVGELRPPRRGRTARVE